MNGNLKTKSCFTVFSKLHTFCHHWYTHPMRDVSKTIPRHEPVRFARAAAGCSHSRGRSFIAPEMISIPKVGQYKLMPDLTISRDATVQNSGSHLDFTRIWKCGNVRRMTLTCSVTVGQMLLAQRSRPAYLMSKRSRAMQRGYNLEGRQVCTC